MSNRAPSSFHVIVSPAVTRPFGVSNVMGLKPEIRYGSATVKRPSSEVKVSEPPDGGWFFIFSALTPCADARIADPTTRASSNAGRARFFTESPSYRSEERRVGKE